MKMKGVDPSKHEVSAELVSPPLYFPRVDADFGQERISTYYGKVKAIEEPESRTLRYPRLLS